MQHTATGRDELERRRQASLSSPTDLNEAATKDIAGAMNAILADLVALYFKSKNFHWYMSGPPFATIIFYSTSKQTRSLR